MAAGLPPKRLFQISEDENVTGSSLGSEVPASSTSSTPSKKKRNLPRSPNSDVEVIALSPRTLMATNRFICEVCNKGFPRGQNLQLHRRSHNLPWKLKQKSTKEVKKKVYLCPEPTCVHHDPSRALGDLTGIKKHFSRKHGEKKWKCEKCSKKYAVQSDWKAHSKTCGTREYRCDCGTLFSRRDSFITHRAFCDALAQESATLPTGLNAMGGQLYASNNMGLGLSQYQMGSLADQNQPAANILSLGAVGTSQIFDPDASSSNPSFRQQNRPLTASTGNQDFQEDSRPEFLQSKRPTHYHGLSQLPDISVNNNNNNNMSAMKASSNIFDLGFLSSNINNKEIGRGNNLTIQDQFDVNIMSDPNITMTLPSLYNSQLRSDCVLPQMSATALLQKAARMGATTSVNHESLLRSINSSTTKSTSPDASSIGRGLPWQDQRRSSSSSPSSSSSWHKATQDLSNSTEQHLPSTFPVRNLQTLDHQMRGSAFHCGQDPHFQEIMNSLVNDSHEPMFGGGGRGMTSLGSGDNRIDSEIRRSNVSNMFRPMEGKLCHSVGVSSSSNIGATDELTRDFLGVGGMLNGGLNVKGSGYSHRDHYHDQTGQQNQFNMNSGPMDSEVMFLARSCRERMHR